MTRRDGNTALVQTNTTNWLVTMDSVCRIFLVDVRTQDVFYSVATPSMEQTLKFLENGLTPSLSGKWAKREFKVTNSEASMLHERLAWFGLHGCDNCAGKVSHNPFFACGG